MKHKGYTNQSQKQGAAKFFARIISLIEDVKRNTEQKPTEQNTGDTGNDDLARYTFSLTIATWVIAGAALLTFFAALLQWNALTSTDTAAHRTLLIGQRAFVHLEGVEESIADNWNVHIESANGITIFNVPKNLGKMIHSEFSLTNSGNSPTKTLQIMLHCELVGFQQAGNLGDPFILLKWDDRQVTKRSIGAHQTIRVGNSTCDFKNSDVLFNAQMRVVPVFLIGYVKYEDWIEPGKVHKTEFTHQLVVHDPGGTGFEGMSVETVPAGQHNCTDEDCPSD